MSRSPELERLIYVARALGALRPRVVFIGGSVAPLLQTEPGVPKVRATKDVDGVVLSLSYTDWGVVQEELRALGFREAMGSTVHAHRWLAPDGTPVDLVPAGEHLGATGNRWDALAIEAAIETQIEDGLTIRHVNGVGFILLKWAAFGDRSGNDWLGSHDLEDLIALLASRPELVAEMRASTPMVRDGVGACATALLGFNGLDDLLATHLNNAEDVIGAMRTAKQMLEGMASG